jgi:ABC-type uncharacterized transport system substrate-binding protein
VAVDGLASGYQGAFRAHVVLGRVRACALAIMCAALAGAVHAHPHGSATCAVKVALAEGRVSEVGVTLELDDERSREVWASMQAAPDGTVLPQQRARMAFNLHLVFAQLNYLVALKAGAPNALQAVALKPTRPPDIARHPNGRVLVKAVLVRAQAGSAAEPAIDIQCADPSWYWLVGFRNAADVTASGACEAALGERYQFALPEGLPRTDAPSIAVTQDVLPQSQWAQLRCASG